MSAKTLIKKTEKPELTEMEKKVLSNLYDTSLDNKAIAKKLSVTLSSIKFHAYNIYHKLGVNKRIELKDLDASFINGLIK